MLQVQGISVEVGGRLIVADASFTVMARDKVGLVGRNGAGKTSLFRVLGGAAEPTIGRVVRRGGFGYLPQDPRIDAALEGRQAITHVLSGRGIDDEIVRIEKLRIAMEEDPERTQRRQILGCAGTPSPRPVAMQPTAKHAASRPVSGWPGSGWSCRSAC